MEEKNMSKICASCGAELEDSATFCGKCGKPVSLFTPQPEQTLTSSGDMPAAEGFAAPPPQYQPQPQYQQQGGQGYGQPYGGQPQYQQPYGGGQYQQPYDQNMNAYSQSANVYNQSQYMGLNETPFSPYSQGEQPVTVGQWMLTTVLLAIPIVGTIYFIMLLIGGPHTKKSLTNFARAALIWSVIAVAAYVVLFLALGFTLKDSGFVKLFM